MITDDIRRAAERRLAELEAEAIHLRALVRLYGGSDSAARAIEPATATIARANRGARIIAPEWQPLGRFMASRRGDVYLDDLEACAKRLECRLIVIASASRCTTGRTASWLSARLRACSASPRPALPPSRTKVTLFIK